MVIYYYKILDNPPDPKNNPMINVPLDINLLNIENKNGYGIFWTVNSFATKKRDYANLQRFGRFFVDIDNCDKQKALEKIKIGLPPTLVIETKRGFHVYWTIEDPPKVDAGSIQLYRNIIRDKLNPFYGGDPNAVDAARVLRAPGFYHRKDPANPFLIKINQQNPEAIYTFEEIYFSYSNKNKKKYIPKKKEFEKTETGNCEQELLELSGTPDVDFDQFDFKINSNGTKQILVNGKTSSCWIDKNGLIGSRDGGGPTTKQWLGWYRKH